MNIEDYNDLVDHLEDELDAADPEIQRLAVEAATAYERGETVTLENVLRKYANIHCSEAQ